MSCKLTRLIGMPPAAGVVAAQGDRAVLKPVVVPAAVQQPQLPMMTAASEAYAKDAIIAWFRGEFAAANAIIDALCSHLTQLEGGGGAAAGEYESAFAAIHRRRLNWIPILQMQKYFSIADVTVELKKVVEKKRSENEAEVKKLQEVANGGCAAAIDEKEKQEENNQGSCLVSNENGGGEVVDEDFSSEITDTGNLFDPSISCIISQIIIHTSLVSGFKLISFRSNFDKSLKITSP